MSGTLLLSVLELLHSKEKREYRRFVKMKSLSVRPAQHLNINGHFGFNADVTKMFTSVNTHIIYPQTRMRNV